MKKFTTKILTCAWMCIAEIGLYACDSTSVIDDRGGVQADCGALDAASIQNCSATSLKWRESPIHVGNVVTATWTKSPVPHLISQSVLLFENQTCVPPFSREESVDSPTTESLSISVDANKSYSFSIASIFATGHRIESSCSDAIAILAAPPRGSGDANPQQSSTPSHDTNEEDDSDANAPRPSPSPSPVIPEVSSIALISSEGGTFINTDSDPIAATIRLGSAGDSCAAPHVSVQSSNETVVANTDITLFGTFPNCKFVAKPVTNALGTTTLTISYSGSQQKSATRTLPFVVAKTIALGQPSVTSNLAHERGMNTPRAMIVAGGKLFVADALNHRVLVWNTVPTSTDTQADYALGQPDTRTIAFNSGGVSASSLASPSGLFSDGTRLYVADTENHRVLVWNTLPTTSGQPASLVLGQPDFKTRNVNVDATISGSTMLSPIGIYSVGTKLFVADSQNSRVLVWSSLPTSNGQSANFALGQPNLTTRTIDPNGANASTLFTPHSIAGDGTKLFVTDRGHHRVLIWNDLPTTSPQPADGVLGQPNFTNVSFNSSSASESSMRNPEGIALSGTKLFVADSSNNRVLIWNTLNGTNGQSAFGVVGQTTMTALGPNAPSSSVNLSGLERPSGIHVSGSTFFAADTLNHRVLVWNVVPSVKGEAANLVLGQSDGRSELKNRHITTAYTLREPRDVFSNGTNLVVSDTINNRVLIWNSIPKFSTQPADVVVGQNDFTSSNIGFTAKGLYMPFNAITVGNKLFVLDTNNHRVLGWNNIPTSSNVAADFVLGQPNLNDHLPNNSGISGTTLNFPRDIMSDGTRLFVADAGNSRILVWNTIPTANGAAANYAIGQPNLTNGDLNNGGISAISLRVPCSVSLLGTKLVVGDSGNGRILIWNTVPTNGTTNADAVIGAANFTTELPPSRHSAPTT